MKKNLKDIIKEEITNLQYTDDRTGKSFTKEEVEDWIRYYRTRRISTADRQNYVSFFKAIGLQPKDYKKENPNTFMRLKRDGMYGYYAEHDFDGHIVRFEITPMDAECKGWSWSWYVDGKYQMDEGDGWCGAQLREVTKGLDQEAQEILQRYLDKKH